MPVRCCLVALCLLLLSYTAPAQHMVVATYNIRYDNAGDSLQGNGWRQRCPVIAQLIRFHDFDIFGVQEAKINQLHDLQDSLQQAYAFIGVGRDDGREAGEFAPVFYKKDRFALLSQGTFWLSPVTGHPNKGWDAALPRICTWGKFRETKTNFTFYFFNLHMDHVGVVARRESARLVLDTLQKMAGPLPAILTGDFNVDQYNESYALLNTSGVVKDAYELSPITYALNGTFNGFNINQYSDRRIDHIFLSPAFTAGRYAVLTDSYRTAANPGDGNGQQGPYVPRLPSDHYPVMVQLHYTLP